MSVEVYAGTKLGCFMMSLLLALTSGQKLIIAVLVLVLVAYLIYDWLRAMRDQPPLPHATRRLKKELDRHKNEE